MKRIIALFLSIVFLLTGCGTTPASTPSAQPTETIAVSVETEVPTSADVVEMDPVGSIELSYTGLNDDVLLQQVEDLVYTETVSALDSEEFVVEGVQAIFISKEYIDELMYNSQSNVFFGYTLDELNSLFQGTKYVFTLDESGKTTVVELEEIEDKTTETILKNVAIGTGVILVCVTVSYVTVTAAPAVSVIFAASAKTGAAMALSSGGFGGLTAGIIRYIETGDMDEAANAAALAGSEGFKWGAISGSIMGGGKEAFALKAATRSGLTMNEVAKIQMESNIPMDVIAQFHSFDEYLVYKEAYLKPFMVNGQTALIQSIDLTYVSELPDGTKVTNLTRMQRGYAPLDPTGKPYQLHHIGQKADGTIAVLTGEQHQGNAAILNIFGKESEINRPEFATFRKEFWTYMGNAAVMGLW